MLKINRWINNQIISACTSKSFLNQTVIKMRNRNYNFYGKLNAINKDVLGVDRKSNNEQIREAFIKLSKQYHPDLNKDLGAEDKFKSLQM